MSPLVIAHRGASAKYPENTVEAFTGALEMGADWVELDVRRTGCGTVVVHHDAMLPDGTALVGLSADDLPDSVPTLAEAVEACGPMGINVEIKSDPTDADFDDLYPIVPAILEVVRGRLTPDRVLITSFDMGAINAVHDLPGRVPTGFLTVDDVGAEVAVGRAAAHNHDALNPADEMVTERLISLVRESGLRVYPWTVDEPERMAELIELGVDGIITNVPDVLRDLL